MKHIFPVALAAGTLSSGYAVRGEMYEMMDKKLNMDKKMFLFVINIGSLLLVPANIVSYTFATICIAQSVSVSMLVSFGVLVLFISIASPKVMGGGAVVASVLLAACGVDLAVGFPLFLIIDLAVDNACISCNAFHQMLEAYFYDWKLKQGANKQVQVQSV